jgi:hypothetical protein
MYFQLGFPRRFTLRDDLEGLTEAVKLIDKHNGITPVYRTIYDFDGVPKTETAIIDKLFFDFDHNEKDPNNALFQLRKLHEYLVGKGLRHTMFFSGRGFHCFLATKECYAREFHNPSALTRGAHTHISKEAKITPDPKTKDVCRFARLPNTINTKTGLYCIPLTSEEIYLSRREILKLAEHQRLDVNPLVDGDEFDLTPYDREESEVEVIHADLSSLILDEDEGYATTLKELPDCVKISLLRKNPDYRERFCIITALRDLCYSKEDTLKILKHFLNEKKFRHCVWEERQVDYLYSHPKLLFPACGTLRKEGLCIDGCKGQHIYL